MDSQHVPANNSSQLNVQVTTNDRFFLLFLKFRSFIKNSSGKRQKQSYFYYDEDKISNDLKVLTKWFLIYILIISKLQLSQNFKLKYFFFFDHLHVYFEKFLSS